MQRKESVWQNIDKITLALYFVLVLMGWCNIYAAVYNEEHQNILDISQKYGKQLIWIASSFAIIGIILIIDADFYTVFAYVIYGVFLVLNLAVPFLGREVKGSRSWFRFGDFGLQPAEFMKFATSLVLAKFMGAQNFKLSNYKNLLITFIILGAPLLIIKVLQDETGLAIVFVAFALVLYREGLPTAYLLFGFFSIVLFVLALILNSVVLYFILHSIGVLFLIFTPGILRSKIHPIIGVLILSITLMCFLYLPFILAVVIGVLLLVGCIFGKGVLRRVFIITFLSLFSCSIVYSTKLIYSKLDKHQKERIDILLGIGDADLKDKGYNVNQSKIAIGSGGFFGKGYLQGTQTKYDFVPEQDTDFIFCTVGEEWGFVGSALVIVLFIVLIVRIVLISERQRSSFGRIYGYCVAAILTFHLTVNIGMTIGLVPVIGIPLPFFSYGGSSLWSFTILLFIFLKLDANRLQIFR